MEIKVKKPVRDLGTKALVALADTEDGVMVFALETGQAKRIKLVSETETEITLSIEDVGYGH